MLPFFPTADLASTQQHLSLSDSVVQPQFSAKSAPVHRLAARFGHKIPATRSSGEEACAQRGSCLCGVLNRRGALVGWADTPMPDPYYPNGFTTDCYLGHAFRLQNGVRTDLGVLVDGFNSAPARRRDQRRRADRGNRLERSNRSVDSGLRHAFPWDRKHGMQDLGKLSPWNRRHSCHDQRPGTSSWVVVHQFGSKC